MAKDRFGLDAIMSLQQQLQVVDPLRNLTAFSRAIAGIRPDTIAERMAGGMAASLALRTAIPDVDQAIGRGSAISNAVLAAGRVANNPSLGLMRDIERATRPLAMRVSPVSAMRDIGKLGALAPRYWEAMGAFDKAEHRLFASLVGATRRVALTGIAGVLDDKFTKSMGAAGVLGRQVGLLAQIAELVGQSPDFEDLAVPLKEAASVARAALVDEPHQAVDDLDERWSQLQEILLGFVAQVGEQLERIGPVALVALFISFVSLVRGQQTPSWAEDLAARQVRIPQNQYKQQEELQQALRDRAEIKQRIAELADQIATERLRVLLTNARLHERPLGNSSILTTLKRQDEVILVRVQGRWAMVELVADSRVGWIRKKTLRKP